MRKSIINILYRNVAANPDDIVKELRSDATLITGNWTPRWVAKAYAWVRHHPQVVNYQLKKLEKEKLIAEKNAQFTLTQLGQNQLSSHY